MCCCIKWIIGCGLRVVLIIVNLPILLFGIGLLATGIVMEGMGDMMSQEEAAMATSVALLIIIGSILTIVGFAGVCGAFCNTDLLIKLYALVQIVTFLLSVGMLIAVPIVSNNIEERWIHDVHYNYYLTEEVTQQWDNLQSTAKCCGVYGYTDWEESYFTSTTNLTVPASCCPPSVDEFILCYQEARNRTENPVALYGNGCYNIVNTFSIVMISFLSSTLLFLVINAIVACCLLKMNKDD